MIKTEVTYKQGDYGDRDIIKMINKEIFSESNSKITMGTYKAVGRKIQAELRVRDLSLNEVLALAKEIIQNPPAPEVEIVPPEPTKEELALARKQQLDQENETTTSVVNGKEKISFSAKGMKNMHNEDNELYEMHGKPTMTDHEDDGRIYKYQEVKRLSDGKIFYYNYIWHADWDTEFFEKELQEL